MNNFGVRSNTECAIARPKQMTAMMQFKLNKRVITNLQHIKWSSNLHCVKSVQIRSFFWSVFSCIRLEYGDFMKSPYSSRMKEKTDQKKFCIWTLLTQCWTLDLDSDKLGPKKILDPGKHKSWKIWSKYEWDWNIYLTLGSYVLKIRTIRNVICCWKVHKCLI